MIRHSIPPKVVLMASILVSGMVQADDLAAIRALIGEFKVGIEHKDTLIEAKGRRRITNSGNLLIRWA